MGFFADTWKAGVELGGGVARTNLGNVAGDVVHGDLDAAEKEYEKGIVRSVAGSKKQRRDTIKKENDQRMDEALESIASSVSAINSQLDTDIKGELGTTVSNTVSTATANLGKLDSGA